jgi:hypothetical protein
MKKIIIAVSMLASCLVANAQEPTATPAPASKLYKPVQGNLLAEIGFLVGGIAANPTSLNQSTFGTEQLKFRYFLQDQMAVRVGFAYSQATNTDKYYEATPGSGSGFARDGYSVFGLNVGLEKHFTGTGRLSTYAGGDLSFQKTSASTKWDNSDGAAYVNGQTRKTKGFNTVGDNSSFGFGLRGIVGADYYFVEKVYLGTEFGWGFIASKEGKTKDESTVGGVSTTTETKSTGSNFNLAPSLTLGLRLGFIF